MSDKYTPLDQYHVCVSRVCMSNDCTCFLFNDNPLGKSVNEAQVNM